MNVRYCLGGHGWYGARSLDELCIVCCSSSMILCSTLQTRLKRVLNMFTIRYEYIKERDMISIILIPFSVSMYLNTE